jgi:hypothetical protein
VFCEERRGDGLTEGRVFFAHEGEPGTCEQERHAPVLPARPYLTVRALREFLTQDGAPFAEMHFERWRMHLFRQGSSGSAKAATPGEAGEQTGMPEHAAVNADAEEDGNQHALDDDARIFADEVLFLLLLPQPEGTTQQCVVLIAGEFEEAINTSFCPLQEKFQTFVLRGLKIFLRPRKIPL